MNQKTLIVSCVEYYSYLKNIPGNNVFHSFEQTAILPMILETGENFPEMDLDFYMGLIDGITSVESDAEENDYPHYKERTACIVEVVSLLERKHHLDELAACTMYYHSQTAAIVADEKSGLYTQPAADIFAAIEKE